MDKLVTLATPVRFESEVIEEVEAELKIKVAMVRAGVEEFTMLDKFAYQVLKENGRLEVK